MRQTEKGKSLDSIKGLLFGVAAGDALGVPVEFMERRFLNDHPVTGMRGYGTHNQPEGTWSDDSSLTFCLAEALTEEFSLGAVSNNFQQWYRNNYWTAHGKVFDIGSSTTEAIHRLMKGAQTHLAGGTDVSSNGNEALMRISPLVFYLADRPVNERFNITRQVSSITHGHIRSVIASFYYLEFAIQLLESNDMFTIYKNLQSDIPEFLDSISVDPSETGYFYRLLKKNIFALHKDDISSSGYVLHTLEASIWCLLTTDNFKNAVLKAVNLGLDTDTTGAVTGALAGLLYGYESIPSEWINILARKEDIENLAERLNKTLNSTR